MFENKENSKIQQNIPRFRMENQKSGMYIPLDYSNLYKSIRDGEDIIYSLFYKAIIWELYKHKKVWYTHLLVTTNGLYYGWYQGKKRFKVRYVSWLMVKKINKRKIKIKGFQRDLKPKRERNFETWRSFRRRKKEFSANIQNIMRLGKKTIFKKHENVGVYDEILDRMKYEKKFTRYDPYDPRTPYVDIRKKKMINQYSFMLSIILLVPVLLAIGNFLIYSQHRSWDFIEIFGFLIFVLFFIVINVFYRWWVRKQNFKISQLDDFPLRNGNDFIKD